MNRYYNKFSHGLLMIILCLYSSSCKQFVSVPPPNNQIISDNAFDNDATSLSTITGIYGNMITVGNLFSSSFVTVYAGLSADELTSYTPGLNDEFVLNQIGASNHTAIDEAVWKSAYKFIYAANIAIEKLNASTGISSGVRNSLIAEAKFIRAFCYFHLVNLFGDVPLITGSDYIINDKLARYPKATIYNQIVLDLKDADNGLSASYPTNERTRPNKWTAKALLSKTFLYLGEWQQAEEYCTAVLNAGIYSLEPVLTSVFLKTSKEAIWQLQPVNPNWNTWEGSIFLPASALSTPVFLTTANLLNSFQANDMRKTSWMGSRIFSGQTLYYPAKYKVYGNGAPLTEYYMVLRLAEIYLIRAEAKAQQNKIAEALTDLNVIRNRAGLPANISLTKESLLLAIEQERRAELFCEWGNRWYDLKRTNRVDAVLGSLKPTWKPSAALWPIPNNEIMANPSLQQNPGY